MQSNAQLAPAEHAPLTVAIVEARPARNVPSFTASPLTAEALSDRRGEKLESLAWLLIAVAAASVLVLSLRG